EPAVGGDSHPPGLVGLRAAEVVGGDGALGESGDGDEVPFESLGGVHGDDRDRALLRGGTGSGGDGEPRFLVLADLEQVEIGAEPAAARGAVEGGGVVAEGFEVGEGAG